ncbi:MULTISPECIES: alkene reductase [unclassified Pseudomonas]|uniref:alkene reductase n=1 Tax=unclassified Pseudomonas TaxID=196821 RepID=UPI0004BCB5BA|nr:MULTISPECIES: alkene reductase [unclassified Pseudomonas]SMF65593.1 N-ethylmaleimide reductase [Pseudomonas sp. LAMO17WK12:I1]
MTSENYGNDGVLLSSISLGRVKLKNRIVMAPMTRNRANGENIPVDLTVEYYAQRASVGLIVTEATQISASSQGYANTPGLHTPEQIQGWSEVTKEVHKRGGTIFVQLWHTGRISHVNFQPDKNAPVAPSAIAAKAKTFIPGQGFVNTSLPRALTIEEIASIVNDFRQASANAIKAGFDGVEIHAGHGYLIDAFLRDGSNQRNDQYGGSISNRSRFLVEVMESVIAEIGKERVGVRISPVSPVNDSSDSNPRDLFTYVVQALEKLSPVYIHVVEGMTGGPRDNVPFDYDALRRLYSGVWILNNGYTKQMAEVALSDGVADMISFGRPLIFNPDLPRRFRDDLPLNEPFEDAPVYGGNGPHGYVDYPFVEE